MLIAVVMMILFFVLVIFPCMAKRRGLPKWAIRQAGGDFKKAWRIYRRGRSRSPAGGKKGGRSSRSRKSPRRSTSSYRGSASHTPPRTITIPLDKWLFYLYEAKILKLREILELIWTIGLGLWDYFTKKDDSKLKGVGDQFEAWVNEVVSLEVVANATATALAYKLIRGTIKAMLKWLKSAGIPIPQSFVLFKMGPIRITVLGGR